MKLLADENVANDVIRILRQENHDVLDIKQTAFQSAPDERIQSFAASTHRIILTHDRTLLTPEKRPIHRIVVIVIRPGNQPPSVTAAQIIAVLHSVSIPRSRSHAVRILVEQGMVRIQNIAVGE